MPLNRNFVKKNPSLYSQCTPLPLHILHLNFWWPSFSTHFKPWGYPIPQTESYRIIWTGTTQDHKFLWFVPWHASRRNLKPLYLECQDFHSRTPGCFYMKSVIRIHPGQLFQAMSPGVTEAIRCMWQSDWIHLGSQCSQLRPPHCSCPPQTDQNCPNLLFLHLLQHS